MKEGFLNGSNLYKKTVVIQIFHLTKKNYLFLHLYILLLKINIMLKRIKEKRILNFKSLVVVI